VPFTLDGAGPWTCVSIAIAHCAHPQ
jgi:hypothetical protein